MELTRSDGELSTDVWMRVFREAAELGVLQIDFTGGEPLARSDLVELIRGARGAGLYVNLITSGIPLNEERLAALIGAGLDHFQLSFQDAWEESASEFSGTRTHAKKKRVAEWVKQHCVALTLNFVIHRQNLDRLEAMIELTEQIEPNRVEFAHVQYYGWAFANRERLLPTRQQLDLSLETLRKAEQKLRGRTRVEYVVPDYYAAYPKACMGGWGRKVLLVKPSGEAMPCHAADVIPGMVFENVRTGSLRQIWHESDAFRKFRGEDWMREPCRSCDRRLQDFGGCRCQAFLIANDALATDPVCSLSDRRTSVDSVLAQVNAVPSTIATAEWLYRQNPL